MVKLVSNGLLDYASTKLITMSGRCDSRLQPDWDHYHEELDLARRQRTFSRDPRWGVSDCKSFIGEQLILDWIDYALEDRSDSRVDCLPLVRAARSDQYVFKQDDWGGVNIKPVRGPDGKGSPLLAQFDGLILLDDLLVLVEAKMVESLDSGMANKYASSPIEVMDPDYYLKRLSILDHVPRANLPARIGEYGFIFFLPKEHVLRQGVCPEMDAFRNAGGILVPNYTTHRGFTDDVQRAGAQRGWFRT